MLKLAVIVGGALAGGCVDAKGSFDQFADRVGFTDASTIDRPPSSIFDINGTFLLAAHAAFETANDPDLYVQLLITWDLTVTGDTGTLDASAVPLCVSTACTTHRSMLPPPFLDADRLVAADGTFMGPIVGLLPGMGNPFSGSALQLNGILQATIISADLVCGSLGGDAGGLSLTGSTFAAIRVTDTSPTALPTPIAACPDALPIDAGVDATPTDAATD